VANSPPSPLATAARMYFPSSLPLSAISAMRGNSLPMTYRSDVEGCRARGNTLLEEIHVFFGAFMPLRIACIIEAGIAGVPHNAPCRRRKFTRGMTSPISFPLLSHRRGRYRPRSSPGKGNGDILAIEGRNKKVDCRRSVLGENAGVEDHLFPWKDLPASQRDKKGLLTRRLGLQGEQLAPVNNTVVRHCSPAVQELQSLAQSIS